jgi:hypothetical protein
MKTFAITLVLCAATTGVAAAPASAGDGTENAMERLIRQEDARRNDPRLGLVQERAAAIAARLERHADGRAGDPAPVTRAEPAPSVGRGFDWPSAAVGIAATAAAFLLAFGLAIVARTQRAMRA